MRRIAAVLLALASTLFAPPLLAAAQDAGVHRAPDEIAHDCSADVTEDLIDWIQSVPDGSTLELAPGGCYRIDGTVNVSNRSGLIFAGNRATLQAGTAGNQGRRHLSFFGGRDLVVRDLTVRGAMPNTRLGPEAYREDRAFQHGIELRGVVGATLERVRVLDVFGDFVYVGPGADGAPSRNVNVTHSRFVGSGRQGISITAGEGIAIAGNEIRGVALSVFDLEPNLDIHPARQILIADNVTGGAGSFWLLNPGTGIVGDVTVVDNVMKMATSGLLWMVASEGAVVGPVTLERNRFRISDVLYADFPVGAFYFDGCSGVTITDNRATFPTATRVNAVEIRSCQNVVVDRNTFTGAGKLLVDNTGAPDPSS